MIDKNDPLIGVVQGVMNRNHAEREAAKLVNEKFGIQDRKVLPHERQHEWEAAYKTVLKEGIVVEPRPTAKTQPETKVTGGQGIQAYDKKARSANGARPQGDNPQVSMNEKKLVGKQPNIDVASTTGEKKPDGKLTKHDFDHLRSMEEDVTSPSRMGISKPDYAPPGTTPDYAKSKEQTVNRAAKTSLPAGTVAKSIKEAVLGAQIRGQSTYSSGAVGQQVKAPRPDAKAQGFPARPAASPSTSGTSTAFGGRPAPSNAINNLGRVSQKPVGGARPSVVAKNSITKRGMGWTPSGPATNAGVTALNKQTSQQVPNSGAAKPAAAPAPAAAKPAPAAAKAAPAAAKPVAKKVTPVRKAAPAAGTPVTRMRADRQRNKNNDPAGPGSS